MFYGKIAKKMNEKKWNYSGNYQKFDDDDVIMCALESFFLFMLQYLYSEF